MGLVVQLSPYDRFIAVLFGANQFSAGKNMMCNIIERLGGILLGVAHRVPIRPQGSKHQQQCRNQKNISIKLNFV